MAIKTSQFGSVQLSGEDAEHFAEMVRKRSLNLDATRTLQRGRKVLAKMRAKPD